MRYTITLNDGSEHVVDAPVRSIRSQVVARDARGRVRTLSTVSLYVVGCHALLEEPESESARPVLLPESARVH